MKNNYILWLVCLLFSACSITQYVPDGSYLLDDVRLNYSASPAGTSGLEEYVKQEPNESKLRVRLYSMGDSTSWFKRALRKMGQAPVLVNDRAMEQTQRELQIELVNRGYLHAQVSQERDTLSPKKMRVRFIITPNEPYRIKEYTIQLSNQQAKNKLDEWSKNRRGGIKPGSIFDYRLLEEERLQVSRFLRDIGYYTFSTSNLYYLADTTLQSNQLNLSLQFRDTSHFRPYSIAKLRVLSGYDMATPRRYKAIDSLEYRGITLLYDKKKFLRPRVLFDNITLRKKQLYSELVAQETYNNLIALGAVAKAGVEFSEITQEDTTALQASVFLSPGAIHSTELSVEGTHNAGNLGVGGAAAYRHGNIFNGSEVLYLRLRGAYEFVDNKTSGYLMGANYYEFGFKASLLFPKIVLPFATHAIKQGFKADTQFGINFDTQRRIAYTRNFLGFSWKYKWESVNKKLQHALSVLDVNFVGMPYKSQEFIDYLNQESNYLTKISYANLFTAGAAYQGSYTNARSSSKSQAHELALRYGIESSGNLLQGFTSLLGTKTDEYGQYQVFGNPFAQYLKFDFDVSQLYRLSSNQKIALHAAFGVAYPYGNSKILPFEKRYYGGGPNNVRGWSTRELGPGGYSGEKDLSVQNGDLSLLFTLEYRHKLVPMLEWALFSDLGNIWTIRNYNTQVGGQFAWDRFYKELALGVGTGLRVDLDFLVIRFDMGKRAIDPAKDQLPSWVLFKRFKNNFALYFAIGYPF